MKAVVVGGGLAGLSAALRLAEHGAEVDLLEARPRLGGATHSFPRAGLPVDNGQHVFLRCYTEYLRFLHDIGAAGLVELQDRFSISVLSDRGAARLHRTGGPAPLHLATSLLRYRALSWRDRLRVGRAVLKLRALDEHDPRLDTQSFGDWLRANGQSKASVDALWDLLVVAALNTTSREASLQLAAMVFRTALLSTSDAADIGVPLVPLDELHAQRAARRLGDLGARIHLRAKALDVTARSVRTAGETFDADAVVLAVPHPQACQLLPDVVTPGLGSSPILNAHLLFDRVVLDEPFVAAVGSLVQWTFDRTQVTGYADGQYLAVSVSAARRYVDLPTDELKALLLPEFHRLFPASRDARLLDFFVTREKQATFRQTPGCRALRAMPGLSSSGVFLAGAWTATGWPDTMEGAVRSGVTAAEDVLRQPVRSRQGH